MGEGLQTQGLYYVVGISWAAVAFLAGALGWAWRRRFTDRDRYEATLEALHQRFEGKLEALANDSRNVILENGRALFTLGRIIEEKGSGRRRASPEVSSQAAQKKEGTG